MINNNLDYLRCIASLYIIWVGKIKFASKTIVILVELFVVREFNTITI